ncbi:hypothetical protein [Flavobacterium pedocola]
MKKSIIFLGIASVAFANVTLAINCQQSSVKEETGSTQTKQSFESLEAATKGNRLAVVSKDGGDPQIGNSEAIFYKPYQKTVQEIIAEDNQIIENSLSEQPATPCVEKTSNEPTSDESQVIESIIAMEACPLYSKKTIEQVIFDDSQIIENAIVSNVTSLNLGKKKKVRS